MQLEKTISTQNNGEDTQIQIFMTSHSSTYLTEISNPNYSFSYLRQKSEKNRISEVRTKRTSISIHLLNQ